MITPIFFLRLENNPGIPGVRFLLDPILCVRSCNLALSIKIDNNIVEEPFNTAIAIVVITNAIITDLFMNLCHLSNA
jgi:hypothetical protein